MKNKVADIAPRGSKSTIIQLHLPGRGPATFEYRQALDSVVKAGLIRRLRLAADPLEEVRQVAMQTAQGVVCTFGTERFDVPLSALYTSTS